MQAALFPVIKPQESTGQRARFRCRCRHIHYLSLWPWTSNLPSSESDPQVENDRPGKGRQRETNVICDSPSSALLCESVLTCPWIGLLLLPSQDSLPAFAPPSWFHLSSPPSHTEASFSSLWTPWEKSREYFFIVNLSMLFFSLLLTSGIFYWQSDRQKEERKGRK